MVTFLSTNSLWHTCNTPVIDRTLDYISPQPWYCIHRVTVDFNTGTSELSLNCTASQKLMCWCPNIITYFTNLLQFKAENAVISWYESWHVLSAILVAVQCCCPLQATVVQQKNTTYAHEHTHTHAQNVYLPQISIFSWFSSENVITRFPFWCEPEGVNFQTAFLVVVWVQARLSEERSVCLVMEIINIYKCRLHYFLNNFIFVMSSSDCILIYDALLSCRILEKYSW